jgi:acetylornithine/N-succinyldiaminopimelate aminotransferase
MEQRGKKVLIGNYARLPVGMVRGHAAELFDADGKRYVDLFAGFGGSVLGHCHPELIQAITDQAQSMWAIGNQFYSEPQIRFAERIAKHSFDGRAFFCHSGLEANECGIKLARLWGAQFSPKKWKVVSLTKSFHGRSLAMIAATGNPAVKAGFDPAVPGFTQVEVGDIEALKAACDDETVTVLMEPIQGEGGVNPLPSQYVEAVRRLCDERKMLLHFDEVWTGGGRTGRWFGHQHFTPHDAPAVASGVSSGPRPQDVAIKPDLMSLGKAVGGGLPVGVLWAKPDVAALLTPGKHGCTLGANPICMAVADKVFEIIERDDLVTRSATLGEYAMARLKTDKRLAPKIHGVRGRGLFIGIEFKDEPTGLMDKLLHHGVVANITQKTTLRLAPAMTISKELLDEGLDKILAAVAD